MKALNILIVDDDADDHEFIRSAILEHSPNAQIKSFFDGIELSNFWFKNEKPPDLIILDINMALIDGKTTLRGIRKDEKLKGVPVVILTTSKSSQEKESLIKLGANDYYTKPYSLQEMKKIFVEIHAKWLA